MRAMPAADAAPLMPDTLQWLPASGQPEQLMLLLHGWGASAADMAPLARTLQAAFPQAALLAPQGFEPVDTGLAGRQWFSLDGVTEDTRPARVAAVLPRLADWVRAAQQASGVGPAATALVGFSQGAILALELASCTTAWPAGCSASPAAMPRCLWCHWPAPRCTSQRRHRHGDPRRPVAPGDGEAGRAAGRRTIDIASGVGHTLPPALMQCAVQRLQTHIPHRTWMAAMGAVPGLADRQPPDDD